MTTVDNESFVTLHEMNVDKMKVSRQMNNNIVHKMQTNINTMN